MTSEERVVLYEDDFGYTETRHVFYAEALRPITEVLAELNRDEIRDPESFNQNIGVYLNLIIGRFRSFHETHRTARTIHSAYRAENRQYCLYLRSFALAGLVLGTRFDEQRLVQQLGFSALDRRFQELVKAMLPKDMESLSFINIFELYPSGSETTEESAGYLRRVTIPSFRLLSHNWKEVVRDVIRGANFIVLNAQGETAGIDYELGLIRDCGMAHRTIVARRGGDLSQIEPGEFYDLVDDARSEVEGGSRSRLARRIRSLASDDFRQTNDVSDLSGLPCWVIDRGIEAAASVFDASTLAHVPYNNYIPSRFASNWYILAEQFPRMISGWQALEATAARGRGPTTQELVEALYLALNVFYVGVTLERYHEMALSLSTVGMAHRGITGDIRIMADCYRHAVQCAEWDGDATLAEFLADACFRLEQELAAGSS